MIRKRCFLHLSRFSGSSVRSKEVIYNLRKLFVPLSRNKEPFLLLRTLYILGWFTAGLAVNLRKIPVNLFSTMRKLKRNLGFSVSRHMNSRIK